ncbi:MAG: DUF2148 domain-containing protein [Bacteroidota bacterium]|nr:DUF2148 domain-containing protein [Bacteroidota bacterium]
MAIAFENETRLKTVDAVADQILVAARTAPKGKGRDTLILAKLSGDDLEKLAAKMVEISEETGLKFFNRDAENVRNSQIVIVLGTRIEPLPMPECGYCGHGSCAVKLKYPEVPCAFNTIDLGIAAGVAASIAADHRIDSRIMYSAGKAVKELDLLNEKVGPVLCIPLSVSAKSPYFDR